MMLKLPVVVVLVVILVVHIKYSSQSIILNTTSTTSIFI